MRYSPVMGAFITLQAEDGFELAGYRAAPAGPPRGGLVIIQEIFGVNEHIQRLCQGFAADGYVALAPALFDRVERGVEMRYSKAETERGLALRNRLGYDTMMFDVKAAVTALAAEGLRVGVVGYCLGGSLAWLAATRLEEIAAAVSYYGGAVADFANEQPRAPVMFHFGEKDHGISQEEHDIIRRAHPELPLFVYANAGHGFNCEMRESYDEPAAAVARQRTVEFLREHLG
jgi:carboxymethylenebutenolidase